MAQMNSALALGGIHQLSFNQGLNRFFQTPAHRLRADAVYDRPFHQPVSQQMQRPAGPATEYVERLIDEGLENYVVLHRELKAVGYDGGDSILKSYVSLRRRCLQPDATRRFDTAPSEQAQVDWAAWPTWTKVAASTASWYS